MKEEMIALSIHKEVVREAHNAQQEIERLTQEIQEVTQKLEDETFRNNVLDE